MKILYCENSLDATARPEAVSLLTDSSVSRNRHPLFLPPHSAEWKLTFGVAVRIMRLGKYIAPRFAPRYYDAMTLTARLRPAGAAMPASACLTAFDSAIVTGEWTGVEPRIDVEGTFDLHTTLDTARIDETIAMLSSYFTLKTGDIAVIGDLPPELTPSIGDAIHLTLDGTEALNFKIK